MGAGSTGAAVGEARRLVEAGENVVSVASYWEVAIKAQKGLLSIADFAMSWRRATELRSARVLHIRPSRITALAALPMLHKDPFDRMFIAQAVAKGLTIVTTDGSIGEYPVQVVW